LPSAPGGPYRRTRRAAFAGALLGEAARSQPPPAQQQRDEDARSLPPRPPPSPTPRQGDACALPPGLGAFDACLAANLLCRVPSPAACLAEIDRSLNPGGILVLTSPFTWLEEYTDRAKWLGGRRDELGADGKPVRCADALKGALERMGYTVMEEGKVRGPGRGWGPQLWKSDSRQLAHTGRPRQQSAPRWPFGRAPRAAPHPSACPCPNPHLLPPPPAPPDPPRHPRDLPQVPAHPGAPPRGAEGEAVSPRTTGLTASDPAAWRCRRRSSEPEEQRIPGRTALEARRRCLGGARLRVASAAGAPLARSIQRAGALAVAGPRPAGPKCPPF
jgi:hypothetical protein